MANLGHRLPRRVRATFTLVGVLAGTGWLAAPPPAAATHDQVAIFQDDLALYSNPAAALQTLRGLGVGMVRVSMRWNEIAPAASASRRPQSFDGADPAAYPAGSWDRYDAIVKAAGADGIGVDLVVGGPAPLWAVGPGMPLSDGPHPQWRPSAAAYGNFVQAIAQRYSGHYRPPGQSATLPRVHFWEIWNEPNFGQDLAPQAVQDSKVLTSPTIYRGLLRTAWAALGRTGHGGDTILIGGLSPRGFRFGRTSRWPQGLPGNFSTTKPLQFVHSLYCVDDSFRPLRGSAATAAGCPATVAAARHFRASNPALFKASGFGIHPYPYGTPPDRADSTDPYYAEFSQIPRLAATLDRLLRGYGSHRQLLIYNTEFGYITNPPRRSNAFVSPATAAVYMNWAEYLSWRSGRIASTMQYLLNDPNPGVGVPEYGGFASGLAFVDHRPKPGYAAYRMPIFLPITTAQRGTPVTVWGCVRPAHYAQLDTHGRPQRVQIQFSPGHGGRFRTVVRILIRDPRGYFETRLALPGSGAVRLAWSYPDGQTVTSRVVGVSAR